MVADGGFLPTSRDLTCRADVELMDRTISLPASPPSATTNTPRLWSPRSEVDANEIRHAVRPVVTRSRHPAALAGAQGKAQQADDPSDAKGQYRPARNEDQTCRSVFGTHWPASHGIRTLPEWKRVTFSGFRAQAAQ
jgi:hypothetical protein